MQNELTLRKLRYFVGLAESGKGSQAAVDLNVSQSSITTAVRELEQQLGVRLFRRSAQGMQLTLHGERFLRQAQRVLQAAAEALDLGPETPSTVTGRLELAMSYTVAGYFFPPLLARFRRRYPEIEVRLHEAPRLTIQAGLVDGVFGLAIVLTSNLGRQASLDHHSLLRSRRRLWVGAHHPLLERDQVSLAEVAHHPYVMLNVDEAEQTAMRYWVQAGLKPKTIFSTSSVEAVRSMVASGAGVAVLSDMVYRPWSLEGQRVEQIDLIDPVPDMEVGVAWARERELSGPAKAMRDLLVGAMHRGTDGRV